MSDNQKLTLEEINSKWDAAKAVRTEADRKISNREKRYLYNYLPNGSWEGKRVFIVGGGPTAKDFDYSILKNEIVIVPLIRIYFP